MGKLLVWVGLIALIWLAFRLIAISQRRSERSARDAERDAAPGAGRESAGHSGKSREVPGERIVPCAHCGLYLPASDALHEGANTYCSRAHRDAHRERVRAERDTHDE